MARRELNSGLLRELLAGEAAGELGAEEHNELETMLRDAPAANRDEFLQIAGLLQIAFLKRDAVSIQRMPESLDGRLVRQAATWIPQAAQPERRTVADLAPVRGQRPMRPPDTAGSAGGRVWNWGAICGWAAAATLAAVFIVTGDPRLSISTKQARPEVAMATERMAFLRDASDAATVRWKGSTDGAYAGVSGDVVWSDSRQLGYLRIAGLPANDRRRAQYQLWIVAPERDTHPVDGGVFDVAGSGESIVAIHAKLDVRAPKAFAITLEQPGGVVVSGGPMLAVAAVSS
jgi:Anti-sigma-K factor rskA